MTPKLALALSFTASAALIAASATAGEAEGGRKLQTSLTGAAEVLPADPDGSGTATVTVNSGQNRVCYTLSVSNIDAATAAHIHVGAAGTAPPNNVVVPLAAPSSGSSSGCVTVARSLALAILKNPANYYVNVHNAAFPAGAIRGQLAK